MNLKFDFLHTPNTHTLSFDFFLFLFLFSPFPFSFYFFAVFAFSTCGDRHTRQAAGPYEERCGQSWQSPNVGDG